MRIAAMLISLLIIVFFTCFLGYTVLGKNDLKNRAGEFVTEKTLHHSGSAAAELEMALDALRSALKKHDPASESLGARLTEWSGGREKVESQIDAIEDEIAVYNKDPRLYVSHITGHSNQQYAATLKPSPHKQVESFRGSVKTYYNNTLDALLRDLRIFACTNLIAGLIAFALGYLSKGSFRSTIFWFSLLIVIAVFYCAYMYVDGMTFFRILFRTHLGLAYPVMLSLVVASLWWDLRRYREALIIAEGPPDS